MENNLTHELEVLSQKIEDNSASLTDYKRYETILLKGGMSHDYIFENLSKAGFNTWEDLVKARKRKEKRNGGIEAGIIGGLLGLALGLILVGIFGSGKKK